MSSVRSNRDGQPTSRRVNYRRRWFAAAALAAAAAAWRLAGPLADVTPSRGRRMRVGGASMAPTLWGPRAELRCLACGLNWTIHGRDDLLPTRPVTCCNCGAAVAVDTLRVSPGDLVHFEPRGDADEPLAVGQLVAVLPPGQDQPVAKRLVALAGERVDEVDRWLLVDGQRIDQRFDQLALAGRAPPGWPIWYPVHDDRHRRAGRSRWQPTAAAPEEANRSEPPVDRQDDGTPGVRLTAAGFQLQCGVAERPSAWLVYHHGDVYDRLRPDAVRDDIPWNATESRQLEPVDRLRLTVRVDSTDGGWLEVVIVAGGQRTIIGYEVPPGVDSRPLVFDSDQHSTAARPADPPVDRTRPLAIRLRRGSVRLSHLRLWRPHRYRGAAGQPKLPWPIQLRENQVFVLGDNVPLSVDSRHFGPLDTDRLLGRLHR